MSAPQNTRPSFLQNGDLEKSQYHEDARSDQHDHETSDEHSDHDGSSHYDEDHEGVEDSNPVPLTQPITRQKTSASRASGDLRRTASNVLSAVVSRVTTRGWPEPPPPPDGGLKAWTQVACVCL